MKLGKHSYFLGTDHGRDVRVGNFTSIAGGVYIHGPDNHACKWDKKLVSCFDLGVFGATFCFSGQGPDAQIGNDVWIGEFAQILSGVVIGDGAIIGAHTVVAKDVPPYAVFIGNPGRVHHYRFSEQIVKKLLEMKWWNWEDEVIKERLSNFSDIEKFIAAYG